MANVSLWGNDYTNVPEVDLPKTGGGTAKFIDEAKMYPKGTYTITAQFSYSMDGSNYHALWPLPLGNDYTSASATVLSQVGVSTPGISTSDITVRILGYNCVDIYTSKSAARGKTFSFNLTLQ